MLKGKANKNTLVLYIFSSNLNENFSSFPGLVSVTYLLIFFLFILYSIKNKKGE
jgi:hypothetical protein